ncbi:MAG: hypothetical protein M3N93_09015 [Acidobacteriota bacterium]|nr:hypothetical protein [Acidobacteriota bacterium]
MKAKLITLNLLLAVTLGAIAWQARIRWIEAQTRRDSNLHVKVKALPPPPASPVPKPEGAQAAKYADVATKNLFAKDRNPNIVIDPPKVEKPKEMPSLPVVYGVLGLPSGTKAIMAEKKGGDSRPVHAGDTIGEFKIASLDPQTVVFDWDGKQIRKKIEDLIDRSSAAVPAAATVTGPQASAQPSAPPRPVAATAAAAPGQDVPTAPGMSEKSCVPGDTSPAGTMVDGYRKSVTPTPFGPICRWLKSQ